MTGRTWKIFMPLLLVSLATPAFADSLPAPTGLSAYTGRCERVLLGWNPVPGATGYVVVIMDHGQMMELRTTSTSMLRFDQSIGLQSFRVQALGDGTTTDSPFSPDFDYNVTSCDAPPPTTGCAQPPRITLTATPTEIWPPNHKMVPVMLSGQITEASPCKLSGTTVKVMDEYGMNQVVPLSLPANGGAFSTTVYLEAWRNGTDADGRLYTYSVEAMNQAGRGVSNEAFSRVPHSHE